MKNSGTAPEAEVEAEQMEQEVPTKPPTSEAELRQIVKNDPDMIKTYENASVGWKPTQELIMDLSVNQFFDEFISDKAPFGFA